MNRTTGILNTSEYAIMTSTSLNLEEIFLQLQAELSNVQTHLAGLLVQHNTTLDRYTAALTQLNSVRAITRETQPTVVRATGRHTPQELEDARRRREVAQRPPAPHSPQELEDARRRREAAQREQVEARQRYEENAHQRRESQQQQRDARAAQFASLMATARARRLESRKRMVKPTVRALAANKLDEPMADACGICMETHTMRDGLHTSCGHCFGAACMKSYTEHPNSKNTCPICRAPGPKLTTYRPRATPKKRTPRTEEAVAASATEPVLDDVVPMAIPEPQETPFIRAFLQRQIEAS